MEINCVIELGMDYLASSDLSLYGYDFGFDANINMLTEKVFYRNGDFRT